MSHRLYRFAISHRFRVMTDEQNAVVPEVTIKITGPSTNSVFQTTSKKGGVNEV